MMKKIGMIVCGFICFANILLFGWFYTFDKQSKENTIELEATVKDVKHVFSDHTISFQIFTEQYENAWSVTSEMPGLESMREKLKEGTEIYFRINKSQKKSINKMPYVEIESLRTEKEELFSLSDYNKCMRPTAHALMKRAGSVALVSGGLLVWLCRRRKSNNTASS